MVTRGLAFVALNALIFMASAQVWWMSAIAPLFGWAGP